MVYEQYPQHLILQSKPFLYPIRHLSNTNYFSIFFFQEFYKQKVTLFVGNRILFDLHISTADFQSKLPSSNAQFNISECAVNDENKINADINFCNIIETSD